MSGFRRYRGPALYSFIVLVALALASASPAPAQRADRVVPSIELSGTIDPATERWMERSLDDAADDGAPLVIVRMDTPGGLDSSMRSIIKRILAAPIPVVVYVSPDGARAASAGLYITEAADVAAMAPQTNIGSATPISVGGGDFGKVLGRKIRNDSAAYVRALTAGHGRNPKLAEEMVRDAKNVTAQEALQAHLIDVVAPSQEALLKRLDGFAVQGPKARTLDTEGLRIERRDMSLQYQALQILVNPTISYLLLLIGIAGIAFELLSPGIVAPGVVGGISLLLGLYGSAQLPVEAAGVLLLLLAFGLFIAEIKIASHGVLGAGGVAALIGAGLLLYDTDSSALDVSVPAVIAVAVLLGGFTLFAVTKALRARRTPVLVGWQNLLGDTGTVRVPLDPIGQVFVHGALWRARTAAPGESVPAGARVRVESVDGLTLEVIPAADRGELPEEGEGP
jgi:membrane-bound serine protease (ClpP class)